MAIRIRIEVTSKGSRYCGKERAADLQRSALREGTEVHADGLRQQPDDLGHQDR